MRRTESDQITEVRYPIDAEASKRIQLMKLWLTVMVIIWHADREVVRFADGDVLVQVPLWLEWTRYFLSRVIVRCSVPGFFFLAGLLLYRREFRWADNMKKKLRTLLVPYLLLNTFWIVFYFVGQSLPATRPYFTNTHKMIASWGVTDYLNAYLGLIPNSDHTAYNPMVAPLWFVRDLFVLNLLAPLLKKLIDRLPKLVFLVLTALLVFDIETGLFCLSTTALAFFCFGYYLVRSGRQLTELDRVPGPLLGGLYLAAVVLVWLTRDLPVQPLCKNAAIVIGFCFFFRFFTRFASPAAERLLLFASRFSFPIYLFHEPALGMLQKLSAKLLPTGTVTQAVTYFAVPVVIFFGCLLFSALLERWLPGVYRIVTGGRKWPVPGQAPAKTA